MHRHQRPDSYLHRLPQPTTPPASAGAFLFCPAGGAVDPAVWMVYQMAFQQAQAVVRPSVLERDLLAVWN